MLRDNVLDIAKSWAIFSVIVFHVVITFVNWESLGAFINTYFLTLFFFISGILVKEAKLSDGWCRKQVGHLLLPFLSCWLLYRLFVCGLHGSPIFAKGAIDDAKGGYWFIFVLFVFNILLYGIKRLMSISMSNIVNMAVLSLPFWIAVVLCMALPYDVAGYFSLMSVRRYWLFFVYGYAISNIWHCNSLLRNKRWGIVSCCVYVPMAVFYTMEVVSIQSNIDFAIWLATNVVAIHAYIYILYVLQKWLSSRYVLSVGMRTLGIYVFHYYPLHIIIQLVGGG